MALLLRFRRDYFAALVVSARGANPVRQDRLAALAAVLDLDRLDVEVAPPFSLTGVGGASLRDCHVFCLTTIDAFGAKARYRRVIV
jgi:hypothetical protein